MIIYVPIEPLEERYTEQWYRHFPLEWEKRKIPFTVIDGVPLSNHVGVGTFLDINSTIHYKNTQMQKIAGMFHNGKISDGDVFFFGDLEFWGIESVRLMADMNKVKVRIYGFLHAGSYTKEDAFEIAAPYQKYTEVGWIAACDGVFVGSQYHKDAFTERRLAPVGRSDLAERIIATSNPLFREAYQDYPDVERRNQIVITNRFDWEKRPNMSIDLALCVKERLPDTQIVVTTSRPKFKSNRQWLVDYARMHERLGNITIKENLTKDEYHRELAASKIMLSNSIEENFGYCIVEAIRYGCTPMLPRGLSHNELVANGSMCLFNDEDEAIEKMVGLLNGQITHPRLSLYRSYNATSMITNHLTGNLFATYA